MPSQSLDSVRPDRMLRAALSVWARTAGQRGAQAASVAANDGVQVEASAASGGVEPQVSATAVFEVGAALLGACVGSFLNVVIWRLPQPDPRHRSLGGRSRCPHCGAPILWRDNVPILGWLLRRGRARCCGAPIAGRYPLVETLTAALFLAVAIWPPLGRHVLQPAADGALAFDVAAAAAFVLHATFLALLVACTFIDLDTQLLPDALTKPGMAIGLLGGFWPGIAGVLTHDDAAPVALRSLLASLCGLLAGCGSTWLVRAMGGWFFRREAMGLGDVKFLGMVGAFLGWQGALLTLFLGCVAGAVIGGASMLRTGLGTRIPFGPYLALGAAVSLFAAEPILDLLFVRWPEWQRSSPTAQWFLLAVALLSLSGLFLLVRKARRTS